MNPEIIDLAGGDPCRARVVQNLLTKLAASPDPMLREMASGLLANDLSLREATASETYSEALAHGFQTFWKGYLALTSDEHEALLAEGHRFVESMSSKPYQLGAE